MNDVRKKRELMKYVLKIIRIAKIIIMSIFAQINMIYNDLNLKFRRDMTKFSKFITSKKLLTKLKNNKKL